MSLCDGCGQPVPPTRPPGPQSWLSAPQVARIRALIRRGKPDAVIAAEMQVTPMTVNSIRQRRTWAAR